MTEDRGELDLTRRVEELENSLSIALEVNDKFQRENKELKDRARVAEGETSIVKGIGMNSPEMKALQVRVKELGEINKLHQELNGKLQTRTTELEEDNKRLSQQIGDKNNFLDKMRESGL